MSWSYSQRAAFFDPEGTKCLLALHLFTFGVDLEAEHQAQVKLIDVRASRLSSTEKAVQRHGISRRR